MSLQDVRPNALEILFGQPVDRDKAAAPLARMCDPQVQTSDAAFLGPESEETGSGHQACAHWM